jgi:lipopolysaccharide export LptBFGC system permease protein LptF
MKPFTTIAVIVLAILAFVHLYRLIRGLEIVVNGMTVPIWGSAVVAIVAGTLALMVWRESRRP